MYQQYRRIDNDQQRMSMYATLYEVRSRNEKSESVNQGFHVDTVVNGLRV